MSLAEKWGKFIHEYYRDNRFAAMTMEERLEAAFYSGSEAVLITPSGKTSMQHLEECKEEVDHFRSHK